MSAITGTSAAVYYPDSDGELIADNTLQFAWIVAIQGNLDVLFRDRDDVFVAGDHLIYPVEGDNTVRQAPDVYVAFGRPKGHRRSYRVSEEGGIFPQVVFEVLSPGNRAGEMNRKRAFYAKYGVEEYYVLDPDDDLLDGWVRSGEVLQAVPDMNGFVSPRLGVRFEVGGEAVAVFYPDGRRFLTFREFGALEEQTRRRAQEAEQKAERLAARLRELGVDPDSV